MYKNSFNQCQFGKFNIIKYQNWPICHLHHYQKCPHPPPHSEASPTYFDLCTVTPKPSHPLPRQILVKTAVFTEDYQERDALRCWCNGLEAGTKDQLLA